MVFPKNDVIQATMYPMQVRQDFEGAFKGRKPFQIQAYHQDKKSFQLLIGNTLTDYEYIEDDAFELEQLTKDFAKQFGFKICQSELGTHKGYPCMEALLRKDSCIGLVLKTKLIIKGAHYYLAVCSNEEDAESYFESIVFPEPEYQENFDMHYDSSMLFSVNTVPQPEEDGLGMLYNYSNYYDYDYGRAYDADYFVESFQSPATNEEVFVSYETFHEYESWTDSLFWESKKKELLKEDDELYVASQKTQMKGKMTVRDLILSDSFSSREIHVKQVLNYGAFYTLKFCTDSITKPSPFVTTFFETFEPAKDTFVDNDIFEPKLCQLFKDLNSEDSLRSAMSKALYTKARLNKSTPGIKDSLAQFLHHYDADASELVIKSFFIHKLGYLKDSSVTEDLLKLYRNAQGKTTIELACLRALASRKNKKDYLALLSLAQSGDLPLPFYEKDLKTIFMKLDDSLALANVLFPDIFQYLSYPEYKDKIFGLLAEIVDKEIADASIYGLQKKRIIREALNGVKRQLAGDRKSVV